jgi:hypothetical protein
MRTPKRPALMARSALVGVAIVACATREPRDESRQPIGGGGGTGSESPDAQVTASDAAVPASGGASVGDAEIDAYSLAPGTFPQGPPPSHCIAPCLYDALVNCRVPGFGVPVPDPATCQIDVDRYLTCDMTAGYLLQINGSGGRDYYFDGRACLHVWRCTTYSFTWMDATGDLLGEVLYDPDALGDSPARMFCGHPDDPSSPVYEVDWTDPICAPWIRLWRFPTRDDDLCSEGSCEAPDTSGPAVACPDRTPAPGAGGAAGAAGSGP